VEPPVPSTPSLRPRRAGRVAATAGLGLLLLAACASGPVPPGLAADPVDLPRFMGRWHVVAHVPYFAERGHVASTDTYTLKDGGGIAVRYAYRNGFGEPEKTFDSRATVKEGSGNRDWTTWFFGVIPTKYRILEVAPDYSWALIGYPGRDLAWVFGREPAMDDALYADLVARMRGHGVDSTKLVRVPQVPEQVGRPGFAAPSKP
jgi:apolipoprotein D and lipocalin family protein